MDNFELRETLDSIEYKISRLEKIMGDFIGSFNGRMQDQMSILIDCLQDPNPTDHCSQDKYDYIIKLLCNLGYGQSCILENQRKILELLGSKNVGIRTMSMEEKQRRFEKALNEIQNPYNKKGGN